MTTLAHHPSLDSGRRRAVWLVLAFFLAGLGAPCVHCLTMAAVMAPAPAQPSPMEPAPAAMPEGMAADCPLHAAMARQAASPEPAPAEAPCPQPGDCCLEQGNGPAATLEVVPVPAPVVAVMAAASLGAPDLPADLFLPRELGDQRSHAPPSFLTPLRI